MLVTVALPYLFSACAQLTFLVSRRRPINGTLLARDLLSAPISVLFFMWVTFASGYQGVYQGRVVVLFGIILCAVLNGRRELSGSTPQQADFRDGTAAERPTAAGRPPARPDQATH